VSRASERLAMVESVAGYSLMGIPQMAALLGCKEDAARSLPIPRVMVGKREKVDPVDVGVYVLAEKEGISAGEYWQRYGEAQTVENVRRWYQHASRVKVETAA
jgi:hypothetical protein